MGYDVMNKSDRLKAAARIQKAHEKNVEELFWTKVNKDTESGCWEWVKGITPKGYGQFHINSHPRKAHRVSWEIHNGPIPNDSVYPFTKCVLHKCDNRKCVNPDHLFLGTIKDNAHDAVSKGRNIHGEAQPTSKLTESDVRTIRMLHPETPLSKLAEMFPVCKRTISLLISRETWRHVK